MTIRSQRFPNTPPPNDRKRQAIGQAPRQMGAGRSSIPSSYCSFTPCSKSHPDAVLEVFKDARSFF
jgi:hypothetical protein